jgi:nitroimidazol reductase NimA-like FMN-containing flavoprotein (pyridoxamine 5'-phosphate oxidase superfamily)
MAEPAADRPYMPGYGILDPSEGTGILPWAWAEERLVRSHDYWLATVWPDRGPHVMPVWAVWHDQSAWFSSSNQSRKARNAATDPRGVITTDDPHQPVVVEGPIQRIDDDALIEAFTNWVNSKYGTDYTTSFLAGSAVFRLRPRWIFSLDDADFTGSPTRWTFPGTS